LFSPSIDDDDLGSTYENPSLSIVVEDNESIVVEDDESREADTASNRELKKTVKALGEDVDILFKPIYSDALLLGEYLFYPGE
jgi:predicted phage-related endonuclease